jgi:hypothetical protein
MSVVFIIELLLFFTRIATSSMWHYDAEKERQGESVSSLLPIASVAGAPLAMAVFQR